MSRNNVSNPISAGLFQACYNAESVNNTDWNNLTSSDFYDPVTGSQLEAGLKFAYVNITSNNTSNYTFLKLRAAAANDPTANTSGVFSIASEFNQDVQALVNGDLVTTISYKKAASADKVSLYCGFNK